MAENDDDSQQHNDMLPIRMISQVVKGFGRGSKDLGIPTANLDRSNLQSSTLFDDLPTGIYWGYCRIGSTTNTTAADVDNGSSPLGTVYKAAISIGFNPTYDNKMKTVEPHLIADAQHPRRHASSTGETLLQDFYDQPVRLSVVGYLRPELPFEGLDKLVQAIKQDIVHTEQQNPVLEEKEWVGSDNAVV